MEVMQINTTTTPIICINFNLYKHNYIHYIGIL